MVSSILPWNRRRWIQVSPGRPPSVCPRRSSVCPEVCWPFVLVQTSAKTMAGLVSFLYGIRQNQQLQSCPNKGTWLTDNKWNWWCYNFNPWSWDQPGFRRWNDWLELAMVSYIFGHATIWSVCSMCSLAIFVLCFPTLCMLPVLYIVLPIARSSLGSWGRDVQGISVATSSWLGLKCFECSSFGNRTARKGKSLLYSETLLLFRGPNWPDTT